MLPYPWVVLLWVTIALAVPSQKGKCALECYERCMQSGTPTSEYCNCPLQKTFRTCNSVNEKLSKAEILADAPTITTEYLDAHTIGIITPEHPGAFIYVFEFSTVTGSTDDWMFAGASQHPSVHIPIPDPCRDYQFRVIVVIRSADPLDPFVIYRPRAIPVKLPQFAIDPEMITVEDPEASNSMDSLRVNIEWTVPKGYEDNDIYGYESPAIYPIQCKTPEGELPTPRIEIMNGGGRMAVNLPSGILEARCRLWVEVRMLPRCARLEPFLIQKSIELDCEKNPNIDVCKKDAMPSCTGVIDVWGSKGKATVMWQAPDHRTPLYYHVRYGPAQMQGVPPFISWQIVNKRDVKVQGNVKSFTLDMPEDVDYGVQVCAIYSAQRQRAKLGVVPVTPFMCSSCSNIPSHSVGRCGECTKVEGSHFGSHRRDSVKTNETKAVPIVNSGTTDSEMTGMSENGQAPSEPVQTVLRMETDLIVSEKKSPGIVKKTSIAQAAQAKNLKTDYPIFKDGLLLNSQKKTSESIGQKPIQMGKVENSTTTITTLTPEDISSVVSEIDKDIEQFETELEIISDGKEEKETSTTLPVFTQTVRKTTTADSSSTSTSTTTTSTATSTTTAFTTSQATSTQMESTTTTTMSTTTQEQTTMETQKPDALVESKEKITTSREEVNSIETHLEEREESVGGVKEKRVPESTRHFGKTAFDLKKESLARKAVRQNEFPERNDMTEPCLLDCEFGCDGDKTCRCPSSTHTKIGGICERRPPQNLNSHSSAMCLPKNDISATWDSESRTLRVRSGEAREHISQRESADRIFVEFGRIREEMVKVKSNVSIGGFVFQDEERRRQKVVIGAQKVLRSRLFAAEPFIFHINGTVDTSQEMYGLRICTFNSSEIENPYAHNWDRHAFIGENESTVQVVQVSPIHFTNQIMGNENIAKQDTYWHMFFTIGKISILVVLLLIMCVLIYLNCTKLKLFYDRKRTHYFRPFYVDQMNVASIQRQYAASHHPPDSHPPSQVGHHLYAKRRSQNVL